ncbi:hypothetical protein [Lysinibacillus sp. NPDC059133]
MKHNYRKKGCILWLAEDMLKDEGIEVANDYFDFEKGRARF